MLTAAEQVSTRRFCGYGLSSVVPDALDGILATLTTEQEAVLRTAYLSTLTTLENDLLAASENLDTLEAAVWKHDPNELANRSLLFRYRRISLCHYLGVPPGIGVYEPVLVVPDPCCKSGGGSAVITDPVTGEIFPPAILVV